MKGIYAYIFNFTNSKLIYKVHISIYIPTREVDSETEIMCRKFIRGCSWVQHLWRKGMRQDWTEGYIEL